MHDRSKDFRAAVASSDGAESGGLLNQLLIRVQILRAIGHVAFPTRVDTVLDQ